MKQNLNFRQIFLVLVIMFVVLGLLSACTTKEQEPGSAVGTNSEPTATIELEPTMIATAEENLLLIWEGQPLGEGAAGESCGRLEIRNDDEAWFGTCGSSLKVTTFTGSQLEEIASRFAPFDYAEGDKGQLRFNGQGEIDGSAWQSALMAWARATYGELSSGHACAACRTILSWSFELSSETPEECAVLWVTDFGYASLGALPCAGGQTKVTGQGWLATDEWTQLESWLRERAPLSLGDNGASSFLGQGTQSMSEDEQASLATWAMTVAKRLDPGLEISAQSETAVELGLCPEILRPALSLFLPGEGYLITDPISGQKCYTTLDGDIPGLFQAVNGSVFYTVLKDDQFVVKRINRDGTSSLLTFTAVNRDDALLYHSFIVSHDGSHVAWSATSAGPDYAGPEVSNMWMAGIDGTEMVNLLSEEHSGDENRQTPVPVRFSEDNNTLFYTLQPIGMGGMWNAFVGRYDNLYAKRLGTEAEPTLIFDCAGEQNILCIGDFIELEGQVTTLAYVEGGSVAILNGAGTVLNTLNLEDDYVGYPTFGPTGELVFYGADLDEGPNASIMPLNGTIYRVAPPTAPYEVLVSDPGLLFPRDWLDGTHVVASYSSGNDDWGTAIIGLDGSLQVVDSEPNGSYVAVLSQ